MLAIDAVCMGLLAAAAIQWEGTDTANDFSTAVVVLQLFVLCGELDLKIMTRACNRNSTEFVEVP